MDAASHPQIRLPEAHKREGVHYTVTDDGVELPIVDVTHPAFAVALSEAEQRARIDAFLAETDPLTRLPGFLSRPLLRFFLRQSVLARAISGAGTTFLSGMSTYLFKLGADNLGSAYAKPIDRKIAASLPTFSLRLRLQDTAELLADAARSRLAESPPERPLTLLNIAGGPALDSMNALLLLARDARHLLAARRIELVVLDLDTVGPRFGARALAELSAPGAALEGLDVHIERVHYDWANPTDLVPVLDSTHSRRALVLASSEGGLFEYGADAEIVANLQTLRAGTGADFAFVGSVTRADAPMQKLRRLRPVPTRPRGNAVFRSLAERAGYRVERTVERAFSDQVLLVPERPV